MRLKTLWVPLLACPAVLTTVCALSADEPEAKTKLLPWTAGLKPGLAVAERDGRPVLVRVETEFCPWCKMLEQEIARPEVQQELTRWTLVTVDAENSPDEARTLRVTSYPALRVLSGRGSVIGAKDGYLKAADLVAWLGSKFEEAAAPIDDALAAEGEPELVDVVRLVRVFKQPEVAQREAAIRRLLPYPQAAALAVASAFREGNLSTRLAAMELLRRWKAPVGAIDPWRPETIGAEQLATLDTWAAKAATTPPQLEAADLAGARADLARLLAAPDSEMEAIRERLARFGVGLLPEVRERLQHVETDQARVRLTTLRYRLAASDSLALNWPGGIARLASLSPDERHRAADELVRRATARDEPLLVELFSDADPLVREISLRGLKALTGNQAGGALVKLLDDTDPNVRAAVLQELAEDPPAALAPKIAAYISQETDADLVVHGIRALKQMKTKGAADTLLKLLAHESWQVRAEAAETLGTLMSKRYDTAAATEDNADNYVALIGLLSDPDAFVVSRALQAIDEGNFDLPEAVEPIIKATATHPEIAPKAIELLVSQEGMRRKSVPQLRKFAKHERAEVRAAAVTGLVAAEGDGAADELAAALADGESRVRIAAAKALQTQLVSIRQPNENDSSFSTKTEDDGVFSALGRGLSKLLNSSKDSKPADKPEEKDNVGEVPTDQPSGYDEWLIGFRAGKGRPRWIAPLVAPLTRMLEAPAPEERTEAALCLAPLGQHERAGGAPRCRAPRPT